MNEKLTNVKRISIAIFLNLIIVALQIVFGIISHSLALITDAAHNLQDVLSLLIALVAAVWMKKKPTKTMTYGYLRAEALAGFINSGFLIGAIFLIIIASIERFLSPEEIDSVYVILFGFLAFFINAFSAYILGFHFHIGKEHNHEHEHDMNIAAAYLHLLSDAGISLAVAVGGLVMYFFGVYWVDPLLSVLFSLYILKETIPILKKTYNILMEGVPSHVDVERIKKLIKSIENVKDIHDIHIWALSSKDLYFTGHITVKEGLSVEDTDLLIKKISEILKGEGINHITIQPETETYKCENVH